MVAKIRGKRWKEKSIRGTCGSHEGRFEDPSLKTLPLRGSEAQQSICPSQTENPAVPSLTSSSQGYAGLAKGSQASLENGPF